MQESLTFADIVFLVIMAGFIYMQFFGSKLPKNKDKKKVHGAKIVDFPSIEALDKMAKKALQEAEKESVKNIANLEGLDRVKAMEPSFSEKEFLKGSAVAFNLYYHAISTKDEDSLEQLLSPKLFDEIADQIDALEEQGEKRVTELSGEVSAKIVDSKVSGKTIIIDVQYSAELADYIITKTGTVKKGSSKASKNTNQVWTWAKAVNSEDPNWELEAISKLN